jgi:hypothetical protein
MNDDYLTPEEERLPERLRAMPQHTLRPAMRAALREQMMSEFRVEPELEWHVPTSAQRSTRSVLRTVGLVAAIGITAAVLFIQQNTERQTATTSTLIATGTQLQSAELQELSLVPSSTAAPLLSPETLAAPVDQNIPVTPLGNDVAPTNTPTVPSDLSLSPSPTESGASSVVVVEGPIARVNGSRITVYSFEIEVAPQAVMPEMLAVGDVVHVEGSLAPNGVVVASTVERFVSVRTDGVAGAATLNGRVESIDENLLVVNRVMVRFVPHDPILQRLEVGDTVEIWGNFEGEGANSILVPLRVAVAG